MFFGYDVFDLTTKIRIALINQAVFADSIGPRFDKSAEIHADITVMGSRSGERELSPNASGVQEP